VPFADSKPELKIARPVAKLRQGRTDWYRIENKASDAADVYIYDEIGYWGITAQDFVRDLQDIKTSAITLHLNTPGGEVYDSIAIYNALLDHRAVVTVRIDALAASGGSIIAQAGDRRVAARNSTVMIHDAWGLSIGNAEEMRDMAERLDKISDNVASIYAERAGGDVADWRDAMLAETWYDATEALDAGLVDEVDNRDGESADNSWDLSIFTYAGREQAPTPTIPVRDETPEPTVTDTADEFADLDLAGITEALEGAFA
jgi:ATP-dependent Clp endopeptidase proteolytic subunit ClpP